MTDHHDDRIRDALRAEADGVEADPGLLDRINAEVSTPERAPSHRARRLLVVAAAFAIAGATVALLTRDEPEPAELGLEMGDPDDPCQPSLRVALEPDVTDAERAVIVAWVEGDDRVAVRAQAPEAITVAVRTQSELGNVHDELLLLDGVIAALAFPPGACESTTSSSTIAVDLPASTPRPSLVALVREDGMLMTVDLATGEEHELLTRGDPRLMDELEGEELAGHSFIDAVELSPDGRWIYFSICCEPAVGLSYRIPVDGGEASSIGQGYRPRVSPDGRFVATTWGIGINISRVDTGIPSDGGGDHVTSTLDLTDVRWVAWSPDGTRLAYVEGSYEDRPSVVRQLAWDGAELRPVETDRPSEGTFAAWDPEGASVAVWGEPIADDLSLSQDASYQWLLSVDEGGVVRQQAGFQSGDRPAIPGLPKAIAADW